MATLELPYNSMVIESLQLEYRTVLDTVYQRASINKPRGMKVYDAGFTVLKIEQPQLPQLPVETGRKVNLDIAAIEAIQLVAGRGMHDLLIKIAPQFKKYANVRGTGNDGDPMVRRFHGNYGDRVKARFHHGCDSDEWHNSWIECAVYKIKNDRDTRQAVVTIWENELDSGVRGANDYPCTIALTFRIFRGRLDMLVTMRSNDAWKGLPYDVFQFNQVHWTIANMLSVPMGSYYHVANSMHIYDEDTPRTGDVRDRSFVASTTLPRGFSSVTNAQFVLCEATRDYSTSERWYADRLWPYMKDEEKTGDV